MEVILYELVGGLVYADVNVDVTEKGGVMLGDEG